MSEQDWRGVANEDEDPDKKGNLVLARRSRALLVDLTRPHAGKLWTLGALVVADNACFVLIPLVVAYGLDKGIGQAAQSAGAPAAQMLGVRVGGGWAALAFAVAALLLLALFGAWLNYASQTRAAALAQSILLELRTRVFTHAQRLSVAFHERYTSGKVIARLGNDMDTLMEFLSGSVVESMNAALSLVSMTLILFWLDVPLALVGLAGFVPMVVMTRRSGRLQRISQRRARRAIARVITHYVDAMSGIRAVQSYRREQRNEEILAAESAEYQATTVEATVNMANYIGFSRLVDNLSTVAVLLVGSWRVIHGEIQVGVLAAFLMYLRNFYEPLETLAQVFNMYQSAASALEKISGVLEERPAVPEPEHPVVPANDEGGVVLDRVTFSYSPQGPPVLPDCSLSIAPGQVVAMVGETGAGKSTIAKLIARFYDPTSGSVRLDGVDLRDIADAELRKRIVMVTQEPYLFSGTVLENIRLGKADAELAEVIAAARAVGADEFISALPEGYHTCVQKRGDRLSAGERQLVAFARVFLAAPKVIVLDEATASLDIPSERVVQRALGALLDGRTAIIVAHRLSTVEIADRVLVVGEGRILEDGPPAELLRGQGGAEGSPTGYFAQLHTAWQRSLA
ncbi:ABC transporter related protein [Segniliparus rotundus DSM 44985]|uniref:ABC transporter related protein n=1 Tax=Segniliparus rotundus (strain ATCC BAA-972 / CDC 1076 / CIP 108378 / DSM 44985 / JCM 13578) TaxID=640132 RepID=D6ZB92_SEGRD|nr:ABC transporter ATP-binding protein [Segniliparus rotundus]ADG96851.1 ABC transporter related protein [Segniliparus rotundus DSM 44985]